jgi:hypothetical protein
MSKPSFWDHPIEKLEEALHLKKQIHALQAKLGSLFGEEEEPSTVPAKRKPGRPPKIAAPSPSATPPPAKSGRKPFSAETKAKMAAAQRARWAGKSGANPGTVVRGPSSKHAKAGKRTVSPEVRARLAAAMKARWAAAKKKGLPLPNARK